MKNGIPATKSLVIGLMISTLAACAHFKGASHNGDFKVEPADQPRFDQDYNVCANEATLEGRSGDSALYDAEIRLTAINRCLDKKGWKR